MFIHQAPQDSNRTARELPDVFPALCINQGCGLPPSYAEAMLTAEQLDEVA